MTGRSHLPAPLTTFFGREDELREIGEALQLRRLVTLTGPGGVGKTRLAIEAGRASEGWIGEGAWFVDLSPLREGDAFPGAVRTALGAAEAAGPAVQGLVELIGERELLVILDNCEQIVDSVADAVDELLRHCAGLRLLATSREPLGVPGEQVWRIQPLAVPGPDVPSTPAAADMAAVRLFVDRAQLANPAFELTADNTDAIVRILAAIDGLPLAAELAAARVRVLSVEQLAERLGERLEILTGGARTSPERQRTMEAAVRWSHELLPGPEKALFRRLAAFSGGWTLEAAEGVCGFGELTEDDVLRLLESLADRSLVVALPDEGRFRFLEVILEFARQQLVESGEAAEVGARHCHWYARLGAQAAPEWFGPGHLFWLERLSREQENLGAALDWATRHPAERGAGLELAADLQWFWMQALSTEKALGWLTRLLDAPGPASPRASAKALTATTWFYSGEPQLAQEYGERALSLAREIGDESLMAEALVAVARGLVGVAAALHEAATEGARLAERSGNWSAEVRALVHVAMAEYEEDDAAAGKAHLDKALELAERKDSLGLKALVLGFMGERARTQQDLTAAEELYSQALEAASVMGNQRLILMNKCNLGLTLVMLDRRAEAAGRLRESIELAIKLGEHPFVAESLRGLAAVEALDRDPALAAQLLGAADRSHAGTTQAPDRPVVELAFEMARRKLGNGFDREYEAGKRSDLLAVARELLRSRPSPPPERETRRPAGLSPREVEILRLVAGGESNQAIADRLVLSRRTVENHIANVYSKIGAANRVEATRFAVDHGLIPGTLA